MADLANIARPYAQAAFEFARDKQQLPEWKIFLMSAAMITRQPLVARLLDNPETQVGQVIELFTDILKPSLDESRKNFLHLLAQNRRLNVLPEIHNVYAAFVAALEKISNVRVVTAIDIDDAYRDKLIKALSKRIQRDVKLHCEVDPTILGGAVIHMGDHVIDGSIRGKLTRLLEFSLR